jgi:RNA polymerase sigma-70 factor (ECF subfamily)
MPAICHKHDPSTLLPCDDLSWKDHENVSRPDSLVEGTLPEPLLTAEDPELVQVEEHVDMYESISLAFLILLEQLQPAERAVFLLREVFEYDYAEIAAFLGKSEVTCRQLFSRAKKHLGDRRPRFPASPETQRQLLTGFHQAVRSGEMTALMNLMAEEVTLWGDGGGKVPGAATHPITGREAVARFFLETGSVFRRSLPQGSHVELAEVNGQPALITRAGSHPLAVLTIEVEDGSIRTIRVVANPEKLTATSVSHGTIYEVGNIFTPDPSSGNPPKCSLVANVQKNYQAILCSRRKAEISVLSSCSAAFNPRMNAGALRRDLVK